MEEQIIRNTSNPRVTLKNLISGISWEISSSSSEDKKELEKIVDMLELTNERVAVKFIGNARKKKK